ncbi:MAG: toll/interleukin-1 receptor domain-containing protein [Pyrinomonadaceae bacterium]
MTLNAPHIFISYATPDQARVVPFYDYLNTQGFNVWIDCRNLKPGQNWDFEIKRELDKAAFVLAFVSQNSFDRRGYIQRELKLALDKLNEKLIDDIYLIPVLLDDGIPIPAQLRGIQCIKASEPNCNDRIVDAINHQLKRLGVERSETQKKEGIVWEKRVLREAWDGIPGYEVELQHLEFGSDRYPNIREITDYIKGRLLSSLFVHRGQKLDSAPDFFNYGQEKYRRTNTYDAHCGEPTLIGKLISIQYAVHWYGAGAAHPNHHFKTYNFLLEPLTLIDSLSKIFKEPDETLAVVQTQVRKHLVWRSCRR